MRPVILLFLLLISMLSIIPGHAQTVIPNPSFETWTTGGNFSNPTGWDTPNEELMSIPFFGFQVVTRSNDHQGTGSYSAKLETKHLTLPPLDVPGFMTCGNLVVDIATASFVLSGGVPVSDKPTHLKGYFKFIPKGGDSCVIGIGLTRWNGSGQDTVGFGYFSTRDTVTEWTPFSAWIDYQLADLPDSMNIIAMSTAQEVMTPGTVLYVDNFFLDYTVSDGDEPDYPVIDMYQDREGERLLVFSEASEKDPLNIRLVNMRGQVVDQFITGKTTESRYAVPYGNLTHGIYVLSITRGKQQVTKKYFLPNK